MEGISLENHRDLSVACDNLVPLKVAALVWRLLQNKIPSKDNLIKRGSLSESHSGGSVLCGMAESASHLFFDCPLYSAAWHKILSWLNISPALHNSAPSHLCQFTRLLGRGRVRDKIFSVLRFACIWILWKKRTKKIFRNSSGSTDVWIEEIQVVAWKWLKSKLYGFNYSLSQWILNPLDCS
ncbi:uncharacterized protein LOC131625944 [Vicia villosa]|uniref:uncharacterized protein LOC131625944 n=1 Tax=Vicia villosa TaxID=3911 RepID=UPI00273ADBDD|nr:uncharacterized protein LOC131625944 [Vicia villosa]